MMTKLYEAIENQNHRSAWDKGVKLYALELVDRLEEAAYYARRMPANHTELRSWMLCGASNWKQYSEGGWALIYDSDIAERLCTPSELKRTNYGERRPNSREDWLDVQARALSQAYAIIRRAYSDLLKKEV